VSAREQHLATRRAAGLFDFSFMGLYEFADASALQALQTRDLAALVPGQIAYTLLLNPDGSVLIDATVWHLRDGRFWLFTGKRAPNGGRDRSGEYAVLALQGPASGKILGRVIDLQVVRNLRYFRFTQAGDMRVARLGYSGELGYELLVPRAQSKQVWDSLLEAGRTDGLRECSFDAANSLRIESGYVLFDREIDGSANPSELGLERLTGKTFPVRRRLVGLEILDRPAGAHLSVAKVTSECFSPLLGKAIALGFVPPDEASEVRLDDGRAARVTPLPFYDPERRRPRAAPL
jgi:aminomethyltransferase